ncbi:nitroreductase family protein [Feifania hominis]|uniref:Nitroreductase family protein n=1 Tax=Feifania hominis TaxID=2763660 RepID=A0A926HUK9_9FIRM|nr:nitroreductase family protein [Feifania hominis]MBC8536403.1 nitroreductase family protein [Feifania hominis]
MDALTCLMTRRSVRDFTGEPLSHEQLEELIRAGQQAPSGHNTQPWVFLSIRRRETLLRLVPLTPWWGLLENCGAAIVVCADTRVLGQKPMPREFLVHSCAAAMENMLLAAHAAGLGGVWLGMCPDAENYGEFCRILSVPTWARVVGMAAFGRPSTTPAPIARMDPGKWFEERFE